MEQFEKLLEDYRDAVAEHVSCQDRPDPYDTLRYKNREGAAKKALVDFVGPHMPKTGDGF